VCASAQGIFIGDTATAAACITAVLGVTAGDGQIAMPLDAELGLIVNHVARFL
jgi:hypothetical protein